MREIKATDAILDREHRFFKGYFSQETDNLFLKKKKNIRILYPIKKYSLLILLYLFSLGKRHQYTSQRILRSKNE